MIAEALIAHGVGDYLLQSEWMAAEKTKRWWPAIAHGATYTLPFLALTRAPLALLAIAGTHAVIDHYRLARHVCWAKNFLAPKGHNPPWRDCATTGYPPDKPAWMAVWLLIIADNVIHIILNAAALTWLGGAA